MHSSKWPVLALSATLLAGCNLTGKAVAGAPPVNKPYAAAEYDLVEPYGSQKEPGSSFHCENDHYTNGAMIWRTHSGDENGSSEVSCANFKQLGMQLKYESKAASEHKFAQSKYPEGGFVCPDDTVIIGREHDGDENGETRYYCRGLVGHWNETIKPADRRWTDWKKESEFDLKCPANEVLTGFDHRDQNGDKHDENAPSRVQCAKLF